MAARLLRLIALAILALPGCVQDDGSRLSLRHLIEVDEDEEREAGFEFDRWARENLPIIDDPVVMGFINDLGQSMVRTIEPQPFVYRFRVIRDPHLNAFAVPGGYIYFHSATVLRAARLDEVAGVMGHEIAHVKERHYKRMREANAVPALLTQLAAVAATIATENAAPMIVAQGVNVAFQLKYSRAMETEADRYGAVFMTRAGYDVRGMGLFFQRILAEPGPAPGELPPYLFTHPDVRDRIEGIEVLSQELTPVTVYPPEMRRSFRRAQKRLAWLEATGRTVFLRPVLPADKERSDPALRLAAELAARGESDDAEAVLRGAMDAAPRDPRPPFELGELLAQRGRSEEAIAAYRRAVELAPTTGLVLYKLGRTYAEVGDRHRGAYYLEQATLHLGETSAVRQRAELELERLEFPVVAGAGLCAEFGEEPGRERTEFAAGGEVIWWARVAPRHLRERERMRVRWRDPDGTIRAEQRVGTRHRPYVEARFSLAKAAPDLERPWTVEALLDGAVVDRRRFWVRPPGPRRLLPLP